MPTGFQPPEHDERIEPELMRGERVLYASRADPAAMGRKAIPIAVFGLFFGGFALFWILGAAGAIGAGSSSGGVPGAFSLFPLFGLPFLAIGVGMVASPWFARKAAHRALYVITDQRCLIWNARPFRGSEFHTVPPERMGDMFRRTGRGGVGDLVFQSRTTRDSDGDRTTHEVGFIAIPHVQDVDRVVRETFNIA